MPPKKGSIKTKVNFQNAGHQSQSCLMNLPAELRNRIFFLVVADSNVFISKNTVVKTRALKGRYRSVYGHHLNRQPGMLLACKQIYREAIKVYYANADFTFTGSTHLQRWARKVLLENKRCISKAKLNLTYKPCHTSAVVFAEVDFLRKRAGLRSLSWGYDTQGVYSKSTWYSWRVRKLMARQGSTRTAASVSGIARSNDGRVGGRRSCW